MTPQQRYLPFGQVRTDVASPNSQSLITDLGYTGQRNLDEGIGLMDYRARFYSPLLNRFIQPDSIVPGMYNPQAWNRFSYVGNNPINFIDPSGHVCVQNKGSNSEYTQTGSCNGKSYVGPDEVNPSLLTTFSSGTINYSGEMMLDLYETTWSAQMQSTGNHLTIKQFAFTILSYEFGPYGSDNGDLSIDQNYIDDLKTAGSIWFWCSTIKCSTSPNNDGASNENILNWIGAMESARTRYDSWANGESTIDKLFTDDGYMSLAVDVGTYIFDGLSPYSDGRMYRDLPSTWGNGYLFDNGKIINFANIGGYGYKSVWNKFGDGPRAAYILTSCQQSYFDGGDISLCPGP